MKGSFFRIIILLIVMVVLVSISGGVFVRAQEENGAADEVGRPASELSAKVPGQGIEAASSPDGGVPDEVVRPAADPSDKTLFLNSSAEGAPDAGPSAPGADVSVPGAPNIAWKWYTTAGATFIPSSGTMTWNYGGSGCIDPTSTGVWRASINIPDGSVLEYMYFGYWNASGSTTSTAYLYRYNYLGTFDEIKTLNSYPGSTHTGYHYVGATLTPHTVDNLNNSYAFVWGGSTTQQLCYIQIGYIPPGVFGLALPAILKQP